MNIARCLYVPQRGLKTQSVRNLNNKQNRLNVLGALSPPGWWGNCHSYGLRGGVGP